MGSDILQPAFTGEERHGRDDTENRLRQCGVGCRDEPRQAEQYRQATQYALSDDRAECDPSEGLHPFAAFDALRPHGHHDDQQADELGKHAVAVFVLHATDHGRNLVERAERSRPVRNGKPGVVACNQAPRTISSSVMLARNTAKRWCAWLYGIVRGVRTSSCEIFGLRFPATVSKARGCSGKLGCLRSTARPAQLLPYCSKRDGAELAVKFECAAASTGPYLHFDFARKRCKILDCRRRVLAYLDEVSVRISHIGFTDWASGRVHWSSFLGYGQLSGRPKSGRWLFQFQTTPVLKLLHTPPSVLAAWFM